MNKKILYKQSTINYNVDGDSAIPIILIHGFLEELSIWDNLYKKLSTTNKVIAVDLPGFGKSESISEVHSMSLMAVVVEKILNKEAVSECIMIGHSMGGYVCLAFADLFPKKIKGIVLFHSHAAADDNMAKHNRDRTIEIINKNHSKFISAFIPTLFAEENIYKYSVEIKHLTEASLQTDDKGIIAALMGMRDRKDYLEFIKEIDIPVLFIIGKQDSKIPLEKINLQITLPKISEAIILDNVGHMGFIEAKDITFATIDSFVSKIQNN